MKRGNFADLQLYRPTNGAPSHRDPFYDSVFKLYIFNATNNTIPLHLAGSHHQANTESTCFRHGCKGQVRGYGAPALAVMPIGWNGQPIAEEDVAGCQFRYS